MSEPVIKWLELQRWSPILMTAITITITLTLYIANISASTDKRLSLIEENQRQMINILSDIKEQDKNKFISLETRYGKVSNRLVTIEALHKIYNQD